MHILERGKEIKILARSLVKFSSVNFDPPETDWLFFYSPRAVKYFLKGCPESSKKQFLIACFGPGTASTFHRITGHKPDFTGDGKKRSTARDFLSTLNGRTVCFVSGTTSLKSIQSLFPSFTTYTEIAVYQNEPDNSYRAGHFDISVLTSPMNARTFFDNGGKASRYLAVGMGTGKIIEERTSQKVVQSDPGDQEIYLSLLTLLNERD